MISMALNFNFMKKESVCSFLLIIFLSNCSARQRDESVCENQDYLTKTLLHSFLAKNRGNSLIIFRTYKGEKVNQYVVSAGKNSYTFKSDSIEYFQNIEALRNDATAYVKELDEKLTAIGIKEYDGEPDSLGTLIKLYMKNGDVILKSENIQHINYPETLKVLNNSERLCGDWYITPE